MAPPLLALAAFLPLCYFDGDVSLAWGRQRIDARGAVWLDVETWAIGRRPLPAPVFMYFRSEYQPPPPPPSRALHMLTEYAPGKWADRGTVDEEQVEAALKMVTELSVAGPVLAGKVAVPDKAISDIVVRISNSKGTRETIAGADGTFRFPGLPRGRYNVEADAIGYRQRAPVTADLRRCAEVIVPMERYGLREWAMEKSFPLRSMAMAAWSLAREMLSSVR